MLNAIWLASWVIGHPVSKLATQSKNWLPSFTIGYPVSQLATQFHPPAAMLTVPPCRYANTGDPPALVPSISASACCAHQLLVEPPAIAFARALHSVLSFTPRCMRGDSTHQAGTAYEGLLVTKALMTHSSHGIALAVVSLLTDVHGEGTHAKG